MECLISELWIFVKPVLKINKIFLEAQVTSV